jgi:dipeptidyl aminopeptidase/acylaminoacyl peptidase
MPVTVSPGHPVTPSFSRTGLPILFFALTTVPSAFADGWTPEAALKVRSVGMVVPSPDGKRAAFTVRAAIIEPERSEYVTHIHVGEPGGASFQLTQGEKSADNPQWSPDGERIAFVSARAGAADVWLIRSRGGEAKRLTDMPGGVKAMRWSPDGKRLAFVAVEGKTAAEAKNAKARDDAWVVDENIKMQRLWVVGVGNDGAVEGAARPLTPSDSSVQGNFRHAGFDWSPDGKSIVYVRVRTPRPDDWPTADVMVVDLAGGSPTPVAATRAGESSPVFSPDGKWIAYVATRDPPTWAGHGRVHVVPAGGGDPRPLAETFDGFGRYSELVAWPADGKWLAATECKGTTVRFCMLPVKGGEVEPLPFKDRTISGVAMNHGGTAVGLVIEAADAAPEPYIWTAGKLEPAQVGRVNEDLVRPPLGRTVVTSWTCDGMEIEGLLTYPVGYAAGTRVPLLLVVHGGPAGVFTQTYTAAAGTYPTAVFAARGYAVLRVNPRGSSGYGSKFRHANRGDWGGGDYRDIMTGVDHVIKLGVADPERMGVMGWSYGGFMTSWIITQTKRFKAASVGAGVTNLMSFTGTADIPGFLPDYFGGEFWDKFDVYRSRSAMFQVKGVTTPTLIQHGDRDLRVPISQGYELYNALKRRGCTTTMVVYPRTPHGIEEPKLMLDAMRRNLEWFDRHVPGPTR